jgi:HD superfamily phosphodiesterase
LKQLRLLSNKMTIRQEIHEAEQYWLPIIIPPLQQHFSNYSLLSHGFEHHQSVWENSKEIIQLKGINGIAEQLLFACYFHDAGMVKDIGINHGKYGSIILEEMTKENNWPVPENLNYILSAIAHHDKKEYIKDDVLLQVLNMADDLDAFGYLGIFRYAEIYFLRGINSNEIADLVKKNAEKRWQNIKNNFIDFPNYIALHQKRVNELNSFYFNDFAVIEPVLLYFKRIAGKVKSVNELVIGLRKINNELAEKLI